MNPRRFLAISVLAGLTLIPGQSHAQALNQPKIPNVGASKKAEAAAKAAERSDAAVKAAASAEAAEKADKAQSAQKASAKAESAQKAASKAESAQRASGKAESASKAAGKAEAAQRAANKAESAQKAAAKAQSAEQAAGKAELASKAAGKAQTAQKASEKANFAQKAAEKANSASKTADKAQTASKSSEKAAIAQKASAKAEAAGRAAQKANVASKAAVKDVVIPKVMEKSAAAQKISTREIRTERAVPPKEFPHKLDEVTVSSRKLPEVPTEKTQFLRGPAATPPSTEPGKAPVVRAIAFGGRGDTEQADDKNPRQLKPADSKKPAQAAAQAAEDSSGEYHEPFAIEVRRARRDMVAVVLESMGISPSVAKNIGTEVASPGTTEDGTRRVDEVLQAIGHLQLAAVDPDVARKVAEMIATSPDPAGTANEKVGEAATEAFFGAGLARKVPADKRKNFREIYRNLMDIEGSLELLGGDPDDPEVKLAIEEGASKGVVSRDEARQIVERAGQKVLDKQGFSFREGETLVERLNRAADEQLKVLAAMKAAKAERDRLAAAAAAGKGRLAAKKAIEGVREAAGRIPSAAGSTVTGRSISARVELAVGGGKGNASGAGKADSGAGTDTFQAKGSGGKNFSPEVVNTLAAGIGGRSNLGERTTGETPAASSGPAAVEAVPNTPAAVVRDSGIIAATSASAEAASTVVSNTPVENTGDAVPASNRESGQVNKGSEGMTTSPGGSEAYPIDVIHADHDDGQGGTDTVIFGNGTFRSTSTTVTRDANGNVTSSTTVVTSGTWGVDENDNRVVTGSTTSTSSSSDGGNDGGNGSGTSSGANDNGGNGGSTSTSNNDNNGGGSDGDATASATATPEPKEEEEQQTPAAPEEEAATTAASDPNPMDDGVKGSTGFRLAEVTEGRLGGEQARNEQRRLDLAASGGGAGGPNPEKLKPGSTLLTVEEQNNARRLLGMKRSGGVKDPNPLDEGGGAVTARDLKDLHLKGNGGAKGPTEETGPAAPQDPSSPLSGPVPVVPPSTRANASVKGVQVGGAHGAAARAKTKVNLKTENMSSP